MNLTLRIFGWLGARRELQPSRGRAVPRDRRRFAKRSIALGVIGLLLLQLGLGATAENSLYVRDPGYSDKAIRLARQEAANPAGPRIVMLGTSRTAAAFHAGKLREQLGEGVVFNFGIPASGPVTHITYLKRLLAEGHKPDLLILEVLPPSLADLPDGPLESRFFFGDRLRHSELDSVIRYDFPEEAVRSKWRQSVFEPWYALRFPILGRLMPSALSWHLRFDWSRSCDAFGWGAPFAESVTPEEFDAGLTRAKGEYEAILATLRPTGGAARALNDLAALCRERGIPLRLVTMPESIGFRAMYSPEVMNRIRDFLHAVCRDHGCKLVDAREWLPESGFTDGHHVLKSGAAIFTARLDEAIVQPFLRRRP
ncbi:MAG: hypothetical protein U0791_06600 [Gemmataceae bacterium]